MALDVLKLMRDKKFVPGGRGPVEFDCWGFCREIYREFGLSLPDYPAPVENEERHMLITEAMDNPQFLRLQKPEIPCLVALMVRPPFITHVGVMVGPSEAMHITEKSGVVVFGTNLPIWGKRIKGYYRYAGEAK